MLTCEGLGGNETSSSFVGARLAHLKRQLAPLSVAQPADDGRSSQLHHLRAEPRSEVSRRHTSCLKMGHTMSSLFGFLETALVRPLRGVFARDVQACVIGCGRTENVVCRYPNMTASAPRFLKRNGCTCSGQHYGGKVGHCPHASNCSNASSTRLQASRKAHLPRDLS